MSSSVNGPTATRDTASTIFVAVLRERVARVHRRPGHEPRAHRARAWRVVDSDQAVQVAGARAPVLVDGAADARLEDDRLRPFLAVRVREPAQSLLRHHLEDALWRCAEAQLRLQADRAQLVSGGCCGCHGCSLLVDCTFQSEQLGRRRGGDPAYPALVEALQWDGVEVVEPPPALRPDDDEPDVRKDGEVLHDREAADRGDGGRERARRLWTVAEQIQQPSSQGIGQCPPQRVLVFLLHRVRFLSHINQPGKA